MYWLVDKNAVTRGWQEPDPASLGAEAQPSLSQRPWGHDSV